MAQAAMVDCIPDELLLQVFAHLAAIGPILDDPDPWFKSCVPFITNETLAPHPGLRSYPFLGQVCQKWHRLLQAPEAEARLWPHLTLDFGHELITAIHTPLEWSSRRPSEEEFNQLFSETRLCAAEVVAAVRRRRGALRSLTLINSDGFYTEHGQYVGLDSKHDFTTGHLGLLLGLLQDTLQELTIQHCNDLFGAEPGHWSLVGLLPSLRSLTVADSRFRVPNEALAQLSCLKQLEHLHFSADSYLGKGSSGMDTIPVEWRTLTRLTSLELRSHATLCCVPQWMSELQSLRHLDISFCLGTSLSNITLLTGLRVLALQGMELLGPPLPGDPLMDSSRQLPDLAPLVSLTALNLAENAFVRVPQQLLRGLTALQVLDLSHNAELQVPKPLTLLQRLPSLAVVDARGVHKERKGGSWWGPDKAITMTHLAQLSKALKRRHYPIKVLIDTD